MNYLYLLYRPLNYSSIPKIEYNLNFLNTTEDILRINQQRLMIKTIEKKSFYCIELTSICKSVEEYDNLIISVLTSTYLTEKESLFTLILTPDSNSTVALNTIDIVQQPVEKLLDTSQFLIKLNNSDVSIRKEQCLDAIPTNITYSLKSSLKEAIDCTLSYESTSIPNSSNNTDILWYWDQNEPQEGGIGCVVLLKNGKWKSFACGEPTYFACQSITNPLEWQLSEKLASFQNIIWDKTIACPVNYKFGVPRLPIINQKLTSLLVAKGKEQILINLSDVWISLCYMEDANACLYAQSDKRTRLVTVSIIGGLVVILLTFLCVYLNYKRYSKYMRKEQRRQDVQEKIRLLQLNTVPK